jgi:hypothetical protein
MMCVWLFCCSLLDGSKHGRKDILQWDQPAEAPVFRFTNVFFRLTFARQCLFQTDAFDVTWRLNVLIGQFYTVTILSFLFYDVLKVCDVYCSF